jgi:hypothetical protein
LIPRSFFFSSNVCILLLCGGGTIDRASESVRRNEAEHLSPPMNALYTFPQCPSWRDVSLWSRSNGVYIAAPRTNCSGSLCSPTWFRVASPQRPPYPFGQDKAAGRDKQWRSESFPGCTMMMAICPSKACVDPPPVVEAKPWHNNAYITVILFACWGMGPQSKAVARRCFSHRGFVAAAARMMRSKVNTDTQRPIYTTLNHISSQGS